MTNEEMKKALAQGGVAVADIEKVSDKFDAEKITEIVEGASSPKEAFENLHAFYPELEVSKLEAQMNFVQEQLEAATKGQAENEPVELTEKELEMVSGGGFCDWWSNNWKKVAIGAAIVVGAALICTGVGAVIGSQMIVAGTMVGAEIVAVTAAGTGAAIGAAVGVAAGGVTTGVLVETGVLDKVN